MTQVQTPRQPRVQCAVMCGWHMARRRRTTSIEPATSPRVQDRQQGCLLCHVWAATALRGQCHLSAPSRAQRGRPREQEGRAWTEDDRPTSRGASKWLHEGRLCKSAARQQRSAALEWKVGKRCQADVSLFIYVRPLSRRLRHVGPEWCVPHSVSFWVRVIGKRRRNRTWAAKEASMQGDA